MVVYARLYVAWGYMWENCHVRTVCVWLCLLVSSLCSSCQSFVLHCLWLNIVFHNYSMLLLCCGLCQYMSVLLVHFVCCLWYAKCVPRELISRSSASQTADGILRCGLSVSILRFLLCGVRPRGLMVITPASCSVRLRVKSLLEARLSWQ